MPIAFETQHDVHKMLEQFRSRDHAVFRHMSDDEHDRARRFCESHQIKAATAKLRDRARCCREVRTRHQLNRVHNDKRRREPSSRFRNPRHARLAHRVQPSTKRRKPQFARKPSCAQLQLLRAFLARCIQHMLATAGECCGSLKQERALSNARITAEQNRAARDEAATEDAIEFRNAA